VGVLGALITVQWSLALSALVVVVISAVLLARDPAGLDARAGRPV
jgi:hypothetical protein